MKIKNTLLKAFAICATAILTISYIAPLSVYAEDVNNPDGWNDATKVTYGVYDHTEDSVVLSEEDYLSFMNLHGFAKGVYEYYYDTYHDVEGFPSYSDFETHVLNFFGEDFFRALNSGRYLLNVYISSSTITVLAQRLPGLYYPLIYETELKTGSTDTFTFTFSPSGTRSLYWVKDGDNLYFIQPYIEENNISESSTYFNVYARAVDEITPLSSSMYTRLANVNQRGFFFSVGINPTTLTLNFGNYNFKFMAPYSSAYMSGNFGVFYKNIPYNMYPQNFNYENPVFTSFPVWTNDTSVFEITDKSDYLWNTRFYFRRGVNCVRDYSLSPYIVSEYENIPVPTATPTPIATATPTPLPTAIPTITLVPSPTPSGVSPIEGVETMFSLFTRKYDITVMGVTVGIRPFFIFIGCFIVGSVITMIQGGNKS